MAKQSAQTIQALAQRVLDELEPTPQPGWTWRQLQSALQKLPVDHLDDPALFVKTENECPVSIEGLAPAVSSMFLDEDNEVLSEEDAQRLLEERPNAVVYCIYREGTYFLH